MKIAFPQFGTSCKSDEPKVHFGIRSAVWHIFSLSKLSISNSCTKRERPSPSRSRQSRLSRSKIEICFESMTHFGISSCFSRNCRHQELGQRLQIHARIFHGLTNCFLHCWKCERRDRPLIQNRQSSVDQSRRLARQTNYRQSTYH